MQPRQITRQANVGSTPLALATMFVQRSVDLVYCLVPLIIAAVVIISLAGCDTAPKTAGSDPLVHELAIAEPSPDGAEATPEDWTDNWLEAWSRWRSVVPIIENDVLERESGHVTLRFRLENCADTPVYYESFAPHFVAGTYYTHPSGDPYEIEGDDRHIAIWFTPRYYWSTSPKMNKIGPEEEKLFTVSVGVPSDMPDRVTVGVALVGPMVELNGWLGEPRKLRWIEKPGAESP